MNPVDEVYLYDGSLAGFYTCVHTCVYRHEMPLAIHSHAEAQCSLLPPCRIETQLENASRVRSSIVRHISSRALELCEYVFLSCLENKEIAILRYLLLGFSVGPRIVNDLTHPTVATLLKAEKHITGEAHLLLGFVRFADHRGVLMATITPKNFVLPLIAPHFADRYSQETFVIYDHTHHVALVYSEGRAELADAPQGLIPAHSETELFYQRLWKQFYQTIAIKERTNHRCRMTHMPKRYWENMVELP